MALMDTWDQVTVTKLLRRNIEDVTQRGPGGGERRAFFGANIAPIVPVQSRVTRIRIADVKPYGLGQFKAPDATPPLFKTKPVLKEQVIELALLEEMERFTGEEWMLLNSSDELLANGAKLTLLERLRIMNARNERLTEWMRWQAFKGSLTITYPDGGAITVDYGLPAGHTPTAATAWTDTTNADPIEDLYAWSEVIANHSGEYGAISHLNAKTFRLIQKNAKVKGYLSALGRTILLPTTADLQAILRVGTGNFEIIDAGYLPENAADGDYTVTKFIPDNRVMMTVGNGYTLNGEAIADVADGQVLVGGGDNSAPSVRQGLQAEFITNPFSKNVFRRVASARIPRVYRPEAFLWATVGA